MKAFFEWIDKVILKHHKCENNERLFSVSYHTDSFGVKRLEGRETRCAICGKTVTKWGW